MQGSCFEPVAHSVARPPVTPISIAQPALARAKVAWTVRHVPMERAKRIIDDARPRAGDVVLARVERIGQHGGLQLQSGRRATLYEGDVVVVCYGHRYAPDQFESEVPSDLGPCDLAAAGGVASRVRRQHARMRAPTRLLPLGLLADSDGEVLNLRRFRLAGAAQRPSPADSATVSAVPVIAVVGTSMNAGKTTAAACLIRGLTRAGLRVGAAKLTGTGACGDTQLFEDAGASCVLDFVDAGLVTTFRAPVAEVEAAATWMLDTLVAREVDAIVVEIADGLLQRETAALLRSAALTGRLAGVLFASGDAMGAVAGVDWLERRGLRVLALSGLMTAAPLAVREAAEATRLPVFDRDALGSAGTAMALFREACSELAMPTRARA